MPRLTSAVQNLARTTRRDVELHGVTIPAGKKVLLCYAAANRDPREFGATAEELDVERQIAKMLSFSYGTHYCIGAAAARLQGRIVVEEMLRRCPEFVVDLAGGGMRRGTTCGGTCRCRGLRHCSSEAFAYGANVTSRSSPVLPELSAYRATSARRRSRWARSTSVRASAMARRYAAVAARQRPALRRSSARAQW